MFQNVCSLIGRYLKVNIGQLYDRLILSCRYNMVS